MNTLIIIHSPAEES